MDSHSFEINYQITNRNQVNDLYSDLSSSYAEKYFGSPRQLRVEQLKSICSSSAFSVNIRAKYIKEGFGFFSNQGMTFFEKNDACKVSKFVPEISQVLVAKSTYSYKYFSGSSRLQKIQSSIIVSSRNALTFITISLKSCQLLKYARPAVDYSISTNFGIDCNQRSPKMYLLIESIPLQWSSTMARIRGL